MKAEKKRVKSFRLTPKTIKLVADIALEIGRSEGEVVEQCILDQIEDVTKHAEGRGKNRLDRLSKAIVDRRKAAAVGSGKRSSETEEPQEARGLPEDMRS